MANTSTNDKPFTISQIKAYVPIMLNMDKLNYDVWRQLFETHYLCFGVLGHLNGSSRPTPGDDKTWKGKDGLVKMWIYGTISESILDIVLKAKCTARDLWLAIEGLFRDNNEARALQIEQELCTITIGDRSIHDYCKKLKTFSDLLANVDSPISDCSLVMHLLNGLSDKYDSIIVIKHREPFPTFVTARSMLIMEEDRLGNKNRPSTTNSHQSSSFDVLLTPTTNNHHQQHQPEFSYCGDRGCGRGERHNRGGYSRHYNNNTYSPQYSSQQPWHYGPPQFSYTFLPQQAAATFCSSYYSQPPTPAMGILGPYPTAPHNEAHLAFHSPPSTMHSN